MMQQRQIEVAIKEGMRSVPASSKINEIPYLAVTMTSFGLFEVTHIPSGYRLAGIFERSVNAFIAMAEAQAAFNELKIDSSLGGDDFRAEIISKDKYCKALNMTLREWLNFFSMNINLNSEFPWECDGDSPHSSLEKLMSTLNDQSNSN